MPRIKQQATKKRRGKLQGPKEEAGSSKGVIDLIIGPSEVGDAAQSTGASSGEESNSKPSSRPNRKKKSVDAYSPELTHTPRKPRSKSTKGAGRSKTRYVQILLKCQVCV